MRTLRLSPMMFFILGVILFLGVYLILWVYAHGTYVNAYSPSISVNKSGNTLYVFTSHPWDVYAQLHNVTANVDWAHSVPNFISRNASTSYNISAGQYVYRVESLSSSYYNPPPGNHTVYASTDVEADGVARQAWNALSFTWP